MCWLESVIRKMRSHYFASGNWNNCFEQATSFLFGTFRSNFHRFIPKQFIFICFFFAHISFRFAYIRSVDGWWSRAFKKWSTRSAGTLLVIYSLFTYISRRESSVEKLNMWSSCNYSELCETVSVCVCCLLVAMFVFSGTKSIFSSSTFQVSRIFASFVWNRVEKKYRFFLFSKMYK